MHFICIEIISTYSAHQSAMKRILRIKSKDYIKVSKHKISELSRKGGKYILQLSYRNNHIEINNLLNSK